MKKFALLSLLSASLLTVALAADAPHHKAAIGQPAPQFSLPDQNGKTVNLSDYAGKTVVLEWFNPGCPYVQKFYDAGKMNEFAKQYAGKDVAWIAINTTRENTPASNKEAASKWSIDRPILSDDGGKVARMYGAKSTPDMFIIDKTGTLVYSGAIDDQPDPDPKTLDSAKNYVTTALDQLLSGQPISTPQTKSYGCGVKY
ncbi:MAG TPA: thioredoxin family protein [Tepidisphaeraceae bacterium]|jgi:peroxiredoxin|nr:thioredoxin family protein [Tepidisphaeraceae bacterium]